MHIIHATWCPHCHPTTVEPLKSAAEKLGILFFSNDIDSPDQEQKADELVRKFGDWSEDYIIPQVFVEMRDGSMQHILTGYSESLDLTRKAVTNILNSPLFEEAGTHVER